MGRTDRAVRYARHHMAGDEALITAALGLEVDGRRRQVVLLTDKRVLVAGLRGEAPTAFLREGCVAEYEPDGGMLTITRDGQSCEVRAIEADTAHRLIALLGRHRSILGCRDSRTLRHIRIVPG